MPERQESQGNDLLRAENPVAGVAEAGDDIAVLVELLIHGAAVELDVGVLGGDELDAFGRRRWRASDRRS